MKKTQKIITALALSATLALGAAPAFAAPGITSVGGTDAFAPIEGQSTGGAETQLNIYASDSTIQATIPIAMTIATPKAGGAVTAPSANAYKIVNNGTADLTLKSVQGVDKNGWVAVETLPLASAVTGTGAIALTVKAGEANPVPIASAAATAIPTEAATYFTAPKDGGSMGLEIAGKTVLKANTPLAAAKTTPAIAIKYIVAEVPAP